MDRFYPGRSSGDWSSAASANLGADQRPQGIDRRAGGAGHGFGRAPRPAGPIPSGATKRSSDEAGFQHAFSEDHSAAAGLRSFKRLRIDGAAAASSSLGNVTSTTASTSTCGSVSPPLPTPTSSLSRAAAAGAPAGRFAARPVPERPYGYHRHQDGSAPPYGAARPLPSTNVGGAPPHPSEVSFRPLTTAEWGKDPAAELSRSVSSDSAAFHQQQAQHGNGLTVHGDVRDYGGINHVLGDLHALRQQRMESSSQRGRGPGQPLEQVHPSGGVFMGTVGVGAGICAPPGTDARFDQSDTRRLNEARVIPPPRNQQQQPQQRLNQQQLPPPAPRWKRNVRLPSSSQLY